jgi:hypothetical protein
MLKYRWSLPSFFRLVARRNKSTAECQIIHASWKRIGLHSAVFRKPALQAKDLKRAHVGKWLKTPLNCESPVSLQTMECGVEGASLDLEKVL